MAKDGSMTTNPLVRWFVTNTVLTGIFALLWLLFRSGPKPNRLAYPCQQAAFTTASLAFGAPLQYVLQLFPQAVDRDLKIIDKDLILSVEGND